MILYSAGSSECAWLTRSVDPKCSESDTLKVEISSLYPQIRLEVSSNKKLNLVESELQEKNQNEATVNFK